MKDNAIFLNEPLREESEFFARQKTQKHVHIHVKSEHS